MAIKIIKQGQIERFTKTCPNCGCEFEYEQEDVKVDSSVCLASYPGQYGTYVICPCCGKHLDHGYISTCIVNPNVIYTDMTSTAFKDLDCEKCSYRPDPTKPEAGDSPCNWCIKNHLDISTN